MANYFATTRSNYFRVKHPATFEAWCKKFDLNFWTKSFDDKDDLYAISADFDPETEDDFDITCEMASHLHPQDVAILFKIGSEKLRYITGRATAIHPDGRIVTVDLSEIYERAKGQFGPTMLVTEGEY